MWGTHDHKQSASMFVAIVSPSYLNIITRKTSTVDKTIVTIVISAQHVVVPLPIFYQLYSSARQHYFPRNRRQANTRFELMTIRVEGE